MAYRELPPQDVLRQLLDYTPESGVLTWRERPLTMFKPSFGQVNRSAEWSCRKWNTAFSGKPALIYKNDQGYLTGAVLGRHYRAHRIVWAIFYGDNTPCDIDHINGIRSDNRISNLRLVSHAQNMRNMKLPSHNTSGYIGVIFKKKMNKWQAVLGLRSGSKHIGFFNSAEEAAEARRQAGATFGFHENHGR